MHQRDYILRIIEQLGAALVELRRRITRGENPSQTRDDLARTASQAGFDIDLLRGFDIPTLVMLVTPGGDVDPARCWLMAEILYLDGLNEGASSDPGYDSLVKARALYDLVRPMGGMLVGIPEASERIAEIDARLGGPPGFFTSSRRSRSRRVSASRLALQSYGPTPLRPSRVV